MKLAEGRLDRARWVALALVALAYFALVRRFDWLCDDAYISFRYARNLAAGRGLAFNPGESPPVEGFTNLLWVLWLAPFERLQLDVPLIARLTSASCGLLLLVSLASAVLEGTKDRFASVCAAAFLGTLPPFAVWSTSGLETMAFAAALFTCFVALTASTARTRAAAIAAACAVLLRADGFVFVGLALAAAAAVAWSENGRGRLASVLRVGAVVAGLAIAHFLWRRGYFGVWVPNTARVKVEFGAAALELGARYVGTFVLTFPAVLVAGVTAAGAGWLRRDARALAALGVGAGVAGYALAVGGDFMAMGRFLVPALPFVALAFGHALAGERARALELAAPLSIVAVCIALSLAGGWNRHVVPAPWREKLRFRWNNPLWLSEYEQWVMMRDQARMWTFLGRALKSRTKPGESLVLGTIGATGYYSDLVIHDPFGLVNREEFAPLDADARRTPGHQRRVPLETFLAKAPTYLEAALVLRDQPFADVRPGAIPGGLRGGTVAVPEWHEVGDVPGMPSLLILRLTRYQPH